MEGFRIKVVTTDSEMNDAYRVRDEVFTREQAIDAAEDQDGLDPHAEHVVAYAAGRPVGTGRVVIRADASQAKIGRMAVLKSYRRQGVGRAIMETLVELARRRGARAVTLGAQESASGFYERVGFLRTDETFMEVGIPHVTMIKDLAG